MKTVLVGILLLTMTVAISSCARHRIEQSGAVHATNQANNTPANNSEEVVGEHEITITDSSGVAQCQYLDTVYGTSSWYGVFAETGLKNARASAIEKAKKLNATHIVWEPVAQSYGSTQAVARVYRCKNRN